MIGVVVACVLQQDLTELLNRFQSEDRGERNRARAELRDLSAEARASLEAMTEEAAHRAMDELRLLDRFGRGEGDAPTVTLDGEAALPFAGDPPRIDLTEEEGGFTLRITQGDRELWRATIPQAAPGAQLPPLQVRRGASVSSSSNSVNGESRCTVQIDGQTVYDGPGSSVSSSVREENGQRFVEVAVDGRVVYRVGQRPPEEPQDDRR